MKIGAVTITLLNKALLSDMLQYAIYPFPDKPIDFEHEELPKSENVKEIKKRMMEILNINTDPFCKSRKKELVDFRIIYAKFLSELGYGVSDIGKLIKKDHSTVVVHLTRFDDRYKYDVMFRRKYDKVFFEIGKIDSSFVVIRKRKI